MEVEKTAAWVMTGPIPNTSSDSPLDKRCPTKITMPRVRLSKDKPADHDRPDAISISIPLLHSSGNSHGNPQLCASGTGISLDLITGWRQGFSTW